MKYEILDHYHPTIKEVPSYVNGTEVVVQSQDFSIPQLIEATLPLYHDAFQAGVWKESLSEKIIRERLEYCLNKQFSGIWLLHPQDPDIVLGASWFDTIDLPTLLRERINQNGTELVQFISHELEKNPNLILLWHRETLVHPLAQGRGLAKRLKFMIFDHLQKLSNSYQRPILVATRMRDDNLAIIHVNNQLGMVRTGVHHPASQYELNLLASPEPINHEYWIKYIQPDDRS